MRPFLPRLARRGGVGRIKSVFSRHWKNAAGFTLVELMVVIAVIAVLAALLVPAMTAGIDRAQSVKCQSNIRQLFAANTLYAADHGSYVAAAPDVFGADLLRWHGTRSSRQKPFDGKRGPLYEYLSKSDGIRGCPSFKNYRSGASFNAFEDSCGGYGYNDRGVGSRAYWLGYNNAGVSCGISPGAIRQPASTVMFCDTAYPQPYGNPTYLIEYSFAEAYQFLDGQKPPAASGQADPTIHFRHGGRANVVWCDGHVSQETMTFSATANGFKNQNVGWFGPTNNTLFDPF